MMYLCRITTLQDGRVYGEGLSPEAAFEDAKDVCSEGYVPEDVTFWKMEKTKIKISFAPIFSE